MLLSLNMLTDEERDVFAEFIQSQSGTAEIMKIWWEKEESEVRPVLQEYANGQIQFIDDEITRLSSKKALYEGICG